MSFNGVAHGGETFVVPLGWTVEIRLRNSDAAPHSARVVSAVDTLPLTLPAASFAGAESANAEAGLSYSRREIFRFKANRAGNYLIACAVPGHASAGMYLRLVVQPDVSRPSWSRAGRQ